MIGMQAIVTTRSKLVKADFLERLAQGPLLGDGAYYLELERRVVGSYASHIPMAVLDYPEAVLEMHHEFARAGAGALAGHVLGCATLWARGGVA